MFLVIFGPPGAGKGTQAQYISQHYGIPHISTGDIFRHNIMNETPLGREAKRYTEAGQLVPNNVTNLMVRDRIAMDDCATGFLLDGYPRTIDQAEALDTLLKERNSNLRAVIDLVVTEHEVIERLMKRKRADDTLETLKVRLYEYHDKTDAVREYYRNKGLLRAVEGIGDISTITERILHAIDHSGSGKTFLP